MRDRKTPKFTSPRRLRRSLKRIVSFAKSLDRRPYIVFANDRYREILMNWLVLADSLEISNVLVIGYDKRLVRFLKKLGFTAVHYPMRQGKENLWERLYVFEALAGNGIPFIHCDTDAMLLRNPGPYLDRFGSADLIFSQGTIHPVDITSSRGFIVCMGFFSAKGNVAAHELFISALSVVSMRKTDQSALNFSLESFVEGWDIQGGVQSELTHRGARFVISTSPFESKVGSKVIVKVLPHHLFQRYFLGVAPETFLVHPLAQQKAHTKKETLKEMGLWKLRSDWEGIRFDRDSLRQLRSDF